MTIRRLEVSYVDGCLCKSQIKILFMNFYFILKILYFWCFLYFPKYSTKINMKCLGIFFLIVFNILFFSSLNENRSLVRDLSINIVNFNTTIINTLLIIAHFLSNSFILVYLQRDLFRNDIQWKQWFLVKI